MKDLKSQHPIEADGARHVVGSERDSTDALDHHEMLHCSSGLVGRQVRWRRFLHQEEPGIPQHGCSDETRQVNGRRLLAALALNSTNSDAG